MSRSSTELLDSAVAPASLRDASRAVARIADRHIPALDGLRGVAILSVLLFKAVAGYQPLTWIGAAIAATFGRGWVGVDLFFVLSGFLITGILLDSRGSPHFFRNFYARRTLRIFPLYYGTLMVVFIVIPLFWSMNAPNIQHIVRNQGWLWTYTANIAFEGKHKIFFDAGWLRLNHFWSLAIEEQFYLLWPTLVFLCPSSTFRKMCWALVAGALLLRIGVYFAHLPRGAMFYLTPCRVDSLTIGALLALALRRPDGLARMLAPAKLGAIVFGLVSFTILVWPDARPSDDRTTVLTFGFTVLAGFAACLLTLSLDPTPDNIWRRMLEHRSLRVLGKYSYAMYVTHMFVITALSVELSLPRIVAWSHFEPLGILIFVVLYVSVTLAVALLSWNLYEKHFLKAKRFFAYGS
jgi:peptidoglycan/LPS O-acetylase OafA/YrhL